MIKPCKRCGSSKQYGIECPICKRERNKDWQKRNPKKVKGYQKKYNATKRRGDIVRELFNGAQYRAKKKGIPFTISKQDIIVPSLCPVLGIPLVRGVGKGGGFDNSPSLDRAIPELGYVPGNVTVISRKANAIKSNATAEEIEKVANWVKQWNRDTNNGADISPAKY